MKHVNDLTVTVDKSELISRLRVNLDKHLSQVEKARTGFEREARKVLEDRLTALRNGDYRTISIALFGPEDHSRDYSRAIGMLEMHAAQTINVGAEDYARYVEDDWDWKDQWLTSNSRYLG